MFEIQLLNIDAFMIVFIDGKLSKKHSNINKLCDQNIIYLKKNIMNKENDKIKQTTYSGLIIYLKSNIKKPIYMLHISKKQIYKKINLKILILVDKKLKIQILEHFINKSKKKNINNIKMEMNINNHSTLAYYKLVELNKIDYYLSNIVVNQKKYSKCEFYNINIYSYYLYNKLLINLKDEYSKCKVLGLFYPKDKNLIKNKIIINHKNNFTKSNVNYKGIINDTATGILHCYINIKKNITNVYGIQKNSNILLSNNATVKTNPKLKIKSKDVVCTHKTIIGKINEDYIFYLRTRGIKKNLAKTLILLSLINEFLTKIEIKALKKYLCCTKIFCLKDIYSYKNVN